KAQDDRVEDYAAGPRSPQPAAWPQALDQAGVGQLLDNVRLGLQAATDRQAVEIQAFAQSQPHEERLVGLLGPAEGGALADAVPVRLDALGPALRLALGRRGVACSGDEDAAV